MRRELHTHALRSSKVYDITADFGTIVSTDRPGRLVFFFVPDNGIGRALRDRRADSTMKDLCDARRLFHFREGMPPGSRRPGELEEAFEDATRVAVADQIEAGLDVICDGELRRMRFVFGMFDRLSGLERTPPHDFSPERSFARWRRERGSCVQASDVEQGSLPFKSGDRP